MKKIFVIFLVLICMTSCADTSEALSSSEKEPALENLCDEIKETQYIRTGGYFEMLEYPHLVRITTKEELDYYYDSFSGIYSLGSREQTYSDSTIGWIDAVQKYDAKYFKNNDLYMAVIQEGSGSVRHQVNGVENGFVQIEAIIPEVGTDDMAEWHILLEVEKNSLLLGVNVSDSVYSPEQAYDIVVNKLIDTAKKWLSDECGIDNDLPVKVEKTNWGKTKDTGFINPYGYSPGWDDSPVWKLSYENFYLLLSSSPIVFGFEGLEEYCVHQASDTGNVTEHDFVGYCGNMVTTVEYTPSHGDDEGYKISFWGSESVALTDLLRFLDYKDGICKCRPEYTVITDFGASYGISLSGGYARFGNKQVSLSVEQLGKINEIFNTIQKDDYFRLSK